jgi:hypothetical protein
MRSLSPSASPRTRQRLVDWPGLPHRTACTFRFSQPHGASIRPVPGGLVSCHIRSWGCALQSFAPPVQPYAVSGAHLALLSFRRTRTMPHAHRKRPKPTTVRSAAQLLRPRPSNTGKAGGSWQKPPASERFPKPAQERPRLQGFAPHESPPPAIG